MAFFVQGVHGASGQFLLSPTTEQIAGLARNTRLSTQELDDLHQWLQADHTGRGLEEGDASDLAQAGWGVIFAAGQKHVPALREALKPLLQRRREQASRLHRRYYRELVGRKGYRPGESKGKFLARHKVGPGPAKPERLPYYLLLVGDPRRIPFSFQYQLDVQYAVGRLHFDKIEDYARYAEAVVAAEEAPAPQNRRFRLLGTCHPGDFCSQLSSRDLIAPLERLNGSLGWDVQAVPPKKATKSQFAELLGGAATPDLLFSATHGLMFDRGDPRQRDWQGALVCQDWPGSGPIEQWQAFAACDVDDTARVGGLVSFHFACFSAGSPADEDFGDPIRCLWQPLAPQPFVARLAQRLLAHPLGSALAVIGHVERAYPSSIEWPGVGRHIGVFQKAFKDLLAGRPVGLAMEHFGRHYAELACELDPLLELERRGKRVDLREIEQLWVASRDARNYAVIGDPAVRLVPPAEPPEPPEVYRDGRRPAGESMCEEDPLQTGDDLDLWT